MKALKYIGIAVLIVVALPLVAALFVPKEFSLEKSITINAPIEKVWQHTNSLSALDKWSPWNEHDPYMKKEFLGTDGTIGARQRWESKIIGKGSQTISKIEKPALFETDLVFYQPRESHAQAYIKLTAKDSYKTQATWGMKGKMNYPFNIMNLFVNMDKSMGKDFNNGLLKLKQESER